MRHSIIESKKSVHEKATLYAQNADLSVQNKMAFSWMDFPFGVYKVALSWMDSLDLMNNSRICPDSQFVRV